jgi:hypothetical protein
VGGLCGVQAKPVQGTRQPYVSPLRAAGGRGLRARPIGDEWTFEEIDALLDDERVPLELKALLRISDAMLVESPSALRRRYFRPARCPTCDEVVAYESQTIAAWTPL